VLLLSRGDTRGALSELERAVTLDPADAASRYNLAIARLAAGDVEGAIRQNDALRSLDPRLAADVEARLARMGRGP
jgi:Flp pilus assembly protein TadD